MGWARRKWDHTRTAGGVKDFFFSFWYTTLPRKKASLFSIVMSSHFTLGSTIAISACWGAVTSMLMLLLVQSSESLPGMPTYLRSKKFEGLLIQGGCKFVCQPHVSNAWMMQRVLACWHVGGWVSFILLKPEVPCRHVPAIQLNCLLPVHRNHITIRYMPTRYRETWWWHRTLCVGGTAHSRQSW